MNKQVIFENNSIESKNTGNKLANLATFISLMDNCGNINCKNKNIYLKLLAIECIEGGRLISYTDVIFEKEKRKEYLKNLNRCYNESQFDS